MRSMSAGGVAGNCKLRGKKSKVLSCRCCDVRNFKWDYRWKIAGQEAKNLEGRAHGA